MLIDIYFINLPHILKLWQKITFILPYYFGLQNTQSLSKGAYWGYMPFTQSTHYLGFVIIIFSILGALMKKPDKMGKVFWVISLITLVTGFGSFFPLFYKPFFDFFPFSRLMIR